MKYKNALKFEQNVINSLKSNLTVISALFSKEKYSLYGQLKFRYIFEFLKSVFVISVFIAICITFSITIYSYLNICVEIKYLLGIAIGVQIASLNVFYPLVSKILNFANRTLFSQVDFFLFKIPTVCQEMLSWNLLFQLVKGAR
jgi:ABC-type polysaccharide/polyol phosphate export permease